jgi:membrane protein DedA with SNARE-associated domain
MEIVEAVLSWVLALVRDHGPLVLFSAAFVESAAFLGWAVPGEALVAVGGYLIQQGELGLGLAWLSVFAGVLAGDHVAYLVGRYGGRRLANRLPAQGALRRVERLLDRYGGLVVLFGRFSGWLRPAVLFSAGSMGLKYRQFWPYELIGAAAWSAWWLFLGAAGGAVIDRFGDVGHYRAWLLLASGLAAVYLLWHYRADLRRYLRDEPEAT